MIQFTYFQDFIGVQSRCFKICNCASVIYVDVSYYGCLIFFRFNYNINPQYWDPHTWAFNNNIHPVLGRVSKQFAPLNKSDQACTSSRRLVIIRRDSRKSFTSKSGLWVRVPLHSYMYYEKRFLFMMDCMLFRA